ncbi:Ribosome maturation factor RimM [Burkholderiales bacterium]|nr:Ribosome maturation factor RimM [Burkholderiales bacterium]
MNQGAADTGARAPVDLVELGFLRGAFGLHGWTHVQPHSGDAQVLQQARQWWLLRPGAAQPAGSSPLPREVTAVRAQGTGLVAKWRGCEDPESAQALKGWRVAVSRAQFPRLPDGQFYWVDLIGMLVVNRSGQQLGAVRGLRNNGAHDLLEVERAAAGEGAAGPVLIPMVAAYIDAVDIATQRILVDWDLQW